MNRGATFNKGRTHRLCLWRIWDVSRPSLVVVGMNPSKADENSNDATVERCERRAHASGYGALWMLNMLDVIETDSKKLDGMPVDQRCTPENRAQLENALGLAAKRKADILCAWGNPGQKYGEVAWFLEEAALRGVTLFCLDRNLDGSPKHPLYHANASEIKWFGGVQEVDAADPLSTAP